MPLHLLVADPAGEFPQPFTAWSIHMQTLHTAWTEVQQTLHQLALEL
jgi:hypothetical protein